MLNKLFVAFVAAVLLVTGFLYTSKFQSVAKVNVQNDQIEVLLSQMKSTDWNTRSDAFYQLLDLSFGNKFDGQTGRIPAALAEFSSKHPADADKVTITFIELLETENSFVKAQDKKFKLTGETLTEEYTNYYGDLIGTVAGLKDRRSVTALIGAINTGNMAIDGLAEIAPYSIDIVAEKANSNDSSIKGAATIVLSLMLKPATISHLETEIPGSRERIKQILIQKSEDADRFVRLSAIDGLAKLPTDADVVKILEDISKNDPYQSKTTKGETKSYPVREAAKKHLSKIQQN